MRNEMSTKVDMPLNKEAKTKCERDKVEGKKRKMKEKEIQWKSRK